MKSLLREMEEKFTEINNNCDQCDNPMDDCICEDLEEQSVTGGVAGYNTPNAFAAPGKWKSKTIKYESVNTPPSHKPGEHQRPESHEEEMMEKFAYSDEKSNWYHNDYAYPSKNLTNTPGQSKRKDLTTQIGNLPNSSTPIKQLKSEDILENQYLKLIEGYRQFATNDPKISPEKKVNNTIKEIAKKLQEIETLVHYNNKLKTESGIASSEYGKQTQKALTKISERLIKISERVRSLGE
jgi:hypothetical protein